MDKCITSKYFKNKENFNSKNVNINDDSNGSTNSRFKNVLSRFKKVDLDSSSEANDFASPKCLNMKKNKALLKINESKKSFTKQKTNKKTNKKQPTIKAFTNSSSATDTNPEHLEVAIALSKSLQNETLKDNTEDKNEPLLKNNNKQITMLGLEQFRFRSHSGRVEVRASSTDRRRGKIKSKYITPILMIRTEEDRKEMINAKISEILSTNTLTARGTQLNSYKPLSDLLQKCINEDQSLFKKSSYTLDNSLKDFYVQSLNLDFTLVKCGYLLKDWGKIPGRSVSPVQNIPSTCVNLECASLNLSHTNLLSPTENKSGLDQNQVNKSNNCFSPDLFDSDDEKFFNNQLPISNNDNFETNKVNSESLLSMTPSKSGVCKTSGASFKYDYLDFTDNVVIEKENGVCVFESFQEIESYVDLTQSSSDASSSDEESIKTKGDGSLRTKISEIFKNEMNLEDDNTQCSDKTNTILNELNNKNLSITSQDTHQELFNDTINLSCISQELRKTNKSSDNVLSFNSTKSEESIIISDDEINYSCNYGTPYSTKKNGLRRTLSDYFLENENVQNIWNDVEFNQVNLDSVELEEECMKSDEEKCAQLDQNERMDDTILYTAPSTSNSGNNTNQITLNQNSSTPKSDVIIKTTNVTPSVNYNEMSTPKIVRELEKYGIKPLKRQRGIKLLNHIYNSTHPLLNHADNVEDAEHIEENVIKKRKINAASASKCKDDVDCAKSIESQLIVNSISGDNEEFIFERTQSKRILSCRTPLHIAWHNLVSSDHNLQRSILLYEPLKLEVLYKTLKSHGYKYHIQDLLTFLDRKCITIRTEQNVRQRHKNSKKSNE